MIIDFNTRVKKLTFNNLKLGDIYTLNENPTSSSVYMKIGSNSRLCLTSGEIDKPFITSGLVRWKVERLQLVLKD